MSMSPNDRCPLLQARIGALADVATELEHIIDKAERGEV